MRSLLASLLIPFGVLAQGAMPTEFPADAAPPTSDELRAKLAGKVFRVKPADGNTWRLEYKSNGYVFLNTGTGYRDTGKWRVEGSSACIDWQKGSGGCSETRMNGEAIYFKRTSNGEVVALRE